MNSLGAEFRRAAASSRVLRLCAGQSVVGVVGAPIVGCLQHWDGAKSVLCVEQLSGVRCRWCERDAPQWYAYLPLRHWVGAGVERREIASLVQVGPRVISRAGVDGVNSLVGCEVELRRPRGRRFVELQVMLGREKWEHPTCECLATLFGASRFWGGSGADPYRSLLEAVAKHYAAAYEDA